MAAARFLAGFLLGLLALAEAEAAALLWVACCLYRRQEGAAAAAAKPGDQELTGVVPATEASPWYVVHLQTELGKLRKKSEYEQSIRKLLFYKFGQNSLVYVMGRPD